MRNFTEEFARDNTKLQDEFGEHPFELGGETFHVSRVIPFEVLQKVANITVVSDEETVFDTLLDSVLGMLAGGEEARRRFRAVLKDREQPVTFLNLLSLRDWMMQEASGRPPTQPESSSASPSRNGQNETADSSPTPAAASTS